MSAIRSACALFATLILAATLITESVASALPQIILSGLLLLVACLTSLADRPRRGDWLWVFAFGMLAALWATSTSSARAEAVSTFALLAGGGAAWIIGLHLGSTARRQSPGAQVGLVAGLAGMVWLFLWLLASGGGAVFRDALGSGHASGLLYASLMVMAVSRLLSVPPRRGSRSMPMAERWADAAARRPGTVALTILSVAGIAQTASGPAFSIAFLGISGVFALHVEARKGEEPFPFGTASFPALLVFAGLAVLVMISSMMLAVAGSTDVRGDLATHHDTIAEALAASPLLGHGLGAHADIMAAASTSEAVGALNRVEQAGFWPVRWLVEIGIAGTAIIVFGFFHVIQTLWSGVRRGRPDATHGLILCWIGLAAAVIGAGLNEPTFLWLLMFMIAESYAAATAPAREAQEDSTEAITTSRAGLGISR